MQGEARGDGGLGWAVGGFARVGWARGEGAREAGAAALAVGTKWVVTLCQDERSG